jgi:cell wall-associated NlpC family hydrolase
MNSRIPAVAAALVLFLILPVAGLGIAVVAALGGAVAGGGCGGDGGPGGGSQQVGDRVWSAEQTSNAHTIVALAAARRLPKRAAVIAVSTAIVESRLQNLSYGDNDSLGLFQQRPSTGWGSPTEILNPRTATAAFYDRLVTIPRWQTLQPGVAADTVQNSARPERYGPQEAAAAALVDRFWQDPDTSPEPPVVPAASPGLGAVVPPVCPDDGESDIAPSGPMDRSALPPGFALPPDPAQQKVVAFALGAVGMRYVFGAKGPDAYDCSGLTQAAWAAAGVGVSAGTLTQIHDGVPVSRLADLAPGDLLFTPGSLGSPTNPRHVGIYLGHGLLVDAHSSKVGVIMERLDAWRNKIVAIRRVGGPGLAAGRRGFPAPAAAATAP